MSKVAFLMLFLSLVACAVGAEGRASTEVGFDQDAAIFSDADFIEVGVDTGTDALHDASSADTFNNTTLDSSSLDTGHDVGVITETGVGTVCCNVPGALNAACSPVMAWACSTDGGSSVSCTSDACTLGSECLTSLTPQTGIVVACQ
jgi:hypothetical protein